MRGLRAGQRLRHGRAMRQCHNTTNSAICALERRMLLSGVALTDSAAVQVDDALSALSVEFSAYKAGGKSGEFHSQNKSLQIAGVRVAIEAAGEDPAALKGDLEKLHLRGGAA